GGRHRPGGAGRLIGVGQAFRAGVVERVAAAGRLAEEEGVAAAVLDPFHRVLALVIKDAVVALAVSPVAGHAEVVRAAEDVAGRLGDAEAVRRTATGGPVAPCRFGRAVKDNDARRAGGRIRRGRAGADAEIT